MKIPSAGQVREIDAYTIENEPIASIDLMERAAKTCVSWLQKNLSPQVAYKIFAGPGNNGGDGLAIARLLATHHRVEVLIMKITDNFSPDFLQNLERLKKQNKVAIREIFSVKDIPQIADNEVIIDALFGSGLTRMLAKFPAKLVQHINQLPNQVVAIDIPSGLFGEDNYSPRKGENPPHSNIVQADYTLTFQFPYLSFLFPENETYVGKFVSLPIGLSEDFIRQMPVNYHLLEKKTVENYVKIRRKFSHKGNYGHALLVAGSYGKMGAATLAARACLRTGVGLLTVHIPRKGYEIMQITTPESMISIDKSKKIFAQVPDLQNYNAIGIGCGIGTKEKTAQALKSLLQTAQQPLVIDADALNILSENKNWLKYLPKNSILTPHPKEFERLAGKSTDSFSRLQKQIQFAVNQKVILVLKGAHTAIALPDGSCFFNTTGNPGMATAGSGDVLSGIILSLLAQNYSPKQAALLGVYLHGFAGDLAAKNSHNSLIASDIIKNLWHRFSTTASL